MGSPADVWRQVAATWRDVLGQVADDQWDAATPCEGWTVRDLVDHTMGWQAQGGTGLGASISDPSDWASIEPAVSSALDDPASLEGTAEGVGMPKHQVLGFMTADLLVHSWDLARSIGADDTLPAEAVEAATLGLERVPEAMLRSPNMFGPPVEVADDASPQDRLLAFLGRRP